MKLLKMAHVSTTALSAQFKADAAAVLLDLGITDAAVMDATLAELETLANTVLLNTYREEAAAAAGETSPDAYVYLGPEDGVTRPFCDALVNTWLTADEIGALDNGTDMDAMTGGGGYNCRHQWMPIYGDQTAEFEHGDVEAANAEVP